MNEIFMPADKKHIKKEREKAKALKKTIWWKNKLSKKQCYYCGENFKLDNLNMDHIVPLVRGGYSTKRNLVVSCKKCNFEKKHKTLVEIRLHKKS